MTRRILHVDTGLLLRGGQRQVLLLMAALRERGWDSVLAAPPDGTLSRHARRDGFACIPFNPRADVDLPSALRLGLAAEKEGLKLWHAHSARAHAVARLGLSWPISARQRKRRRLVVTRRTGMAVKGGPYHRLKYRDPRIERFIAISESVAGRLQAGGVDTGRINLVPSAVDVERFRSSAHAHLGDTPMPAAFDPELRNRVREEFGIPGGGFLVGAAGALVYGKGFDLLLKAASEACLEEPALYFVVAGEGPERKALEMELSSYGLGEHFRFLGRRKDLPRLYHGLDLFCMPSRQEGLGGAVLEAFAAGVPVLASDAGGLAELLQPGSTGHRVPRGDPNALAASLVKICRNPEPARAMARNAWDCALNQFSVARMAEAVERIYDSLEMNGGHNAAAATVGG